jgi:hypothetical protein
VKARVFAPVFAPVNGWGANGGQMKQILPYFCLIISVIMQINFYLKSGNSANIKCTVYIQIANNYKL